MKAVVSEKGQVTIPKKLRDRLGIRPGTRLEFSARDGSLVAVKEQPDDPFERTRGVMKLAGTVDELIEELRGPAEIPE